MSIILAAGCAGGARGAGASWDIPLDKRSSKQGRSQRWGLHHAPELHVSRSKFQAVSDGVVYSVYTVVSTVSVSHGGQHTVLQYNVQS